MIRGRVDRLGVVLVEVQTPSDGSPLLFGFRCHSPVPRYTRPKRAGTLPMRLITRVVDYLGEDEGQI